VLLGKGDLDVFMSRRGRGRERVESMERRRVQKRERKGGRQKGREKERERERETLRQ
jgi:hypothetical protein